MNLKSKVKKLQTIIHRNTSTNDLHCISQEKCELAIEKFLMDFMSECVLETHKSNRRYVR